MTIVKQHFHIKKQVQYRRDRNRLTQRRTDLSYFSARFYALTHVTTLVGLTNSST